MFGKKTSIAVSAVALLVAGACGSAALAASASHRGSAAQAKASAPAATSVDSKGKSSTPAKETYIAIQDEFWQQSMDGN